MWTYPRRIVYGTHNDRFLVVEALDDMRLRGCGKPGSLAHSDRGATYCSALYQARLKASGFICSMSGKGDCWDNAPMESFWGKMKTEWTRKKYATIEEAKRDIYEYVWNFYPKLRPHASLDYLTPIEYLNKLQDFGQI